MDDSEGDAGINVSPLPHPAPTAPTVPNAPNAPNATNAPPTVWIRMIMGQREGTILQLVLV